MQLQVSQSFQSRLRKPNQGMLPEGFSSQFGHYALSGGPETLVSQNQLENILEIKRPYHTRQGR